MSAMDYITELFAGYPEFKNRTLEGRYLSYSKIEPELKKLSSSFEVVEIGRSANDIPIHTIRLGTGSAKILGWSQMHGNESTTTKALFDLLNLFQRNEGEELQDILRRCTLMFIPMLNPDGAEKYTRENWNSIDLNRDADKLTQKESQILRTCFDSFKPDFCYNLHDQRTIFSAGSLGKPATVSFLAPAMDDERSVDRLREKAMKVIVKNE